jgi:hypothetical protein
MVDWADCASGLLMQGQLLGLQHHFRAGQSMQHIIFSTAPSHGLTDEPRVTLAWPSSSPDLQALGSIVELSFGRTNRWFAAPEQAVVVPRSAAFPHLLDLLTVLWLATLPDTPLPPALKTTHALGSPPRQSGVA